MNFLYSGGLQIRSRETAKEYFRIQTFESGDLALHRLYPSILKSDIPIAQDCFGDQFLIRKNKVIKLLAETGEIEEFSLSWEEFLDWVKRNPTENLCLPDDLNLEEGNLLFAYPPFCTKEGENAVIKELDGIEVILFHADFARQVAGLKDGGKFKVKIIE